MAELASTRTPIAGARRRLMPSYSWYCFGEVRESSSVSSATIREVVELGRRQLDRLRDLPASYILDVLHASGRRLADPADPFRLAMLEDLRRRRGFTDLQAVAALQELIDILDRTRLKTAIERNIESPLESLDELTYVARGEGYVRVMPRGLLAHSLGDDASLGALTSLVRGLITKNVNVVNIAGDPLLPVLFARLLLACDPSGEVGAAIAVLPVGGALAPERAREVERLCDAVVVSNGDEATASASIQRYLVLEAGELERRGIAVIAEDLALTFRASTRPDAPCFVFIDDEASAQSFAGELRRQLNVGVGPSSDGAAVVDDNIGNVVVRSVRTPAEALDLVVTNGEGSYSVGLLASDATRFALADRALALGIECIAEVGGLSSAPDPFLRGAGLLPLMRRASILHLSPFVDPFDFAPDETRDRRTLHRLNRLIAVARERAPFYRSRLPDRPLQSLVQLHEIPLLTPSELRQHLPPVGEGLLTDGLGGAIAYSSSGSSDVPKSIYRTIAETHRNARAIAKGLYLSILAPGDRVANLLIAGHLSAGFLSYTQALESCGVLILPIGGHITFDVMASYLLAHRPDAAVSDPTIFMGLARYVEEHGLTLKIPKIIVGGERLWPEGKAYLTRVLGCERFASTGYAANDSGAIAFQCAHNSGAVHHVHEDLQHLEIVDPETLAPVPIGDIGRVIVTNLDRQLVPTIRYDIGDMGRFLSGPCTCGRTVRRFELMGRSDESVRIGTLLVTLEAVGRIVGSVQGLGQIFRLVVRKERGLDHVIVEAEPFEAVSATRAEEMRTALGVALGAAMPDLVTAMSNPSTGLLTIGVVEPGHFPRTRTGKVKQVVDERR